MKCKNCGTEIDDSATVCPDCGAPASVTDEPESATAAPVAVKKVNVFGIIGFIVSILSAYFSIYYCIASVVGLIFSLIGVIRWKKCKTNGLAVAGLVISILTLIAWGIFWLFIYAIVEALSNITCQPAMP